MALDARRRSSLYAKFVPLIGEDDANALMSEFLSIEADELVTRQFLRAELAERLHEQTMQVLTWLGGAVGVATGVLATLIALQ